MANKKPKHPKLPNGFGSIKKLSGNRTNPYAVYPPAKERTETGSPKTQPALCYVSDWYTGFHALLEYKNGTFDPEKFRDAKINENDKEYDIVRKIIASYNNSKRIDSNDLSFSEVFQLFSANKFDNTASKKKVSKSTEKNYRWAYNQCVTLYDRPMKSIVKQDMQKVMDDCVLGYSSVNSIKSLFSQMFRYCMENGIVDNDYSQYLTINIEKDHESGEPFTEHELQLLWDNKDNPNIQIILILIYSGMRISELKVTTIDTVNQCFSGGIKTTAGKNRIIPFHDSIKEFIHNFDQRSFSPANFRDKKFYKLILEIGMDPLTNGKKHTPHDCRHTFSWLCDKYKVDDMSKHLIMGHSLGRDVEKSVYGHRTNEELNMEIQKIQVPFCH